MPDLQELVITRGGNKNVNMPEYTLSFQITDSTTGAVLRNYTGANALKFPAVLATLTEEQQTELVHRIVGWIANKKL